MKNIVFVCIIFLSGCSTLGFGDFDNSTNQTSDSQMVSGKVPVKFTYQPLIGGKHQVFIAGDFNNWSESETPMKENDGIYEITLHLKQGKYGYKFIVDGQWMADENADEFIDDGFGGKNSIVFVGNKKDIDALRKVDFTHRPGGVVKEVYLVGSINNWNQKATRMLEVKEGVYGISLLLKPDEYHYKFLEDGMRWITDESEESFVDDGFGGRNSVLIVNDSFQRVTIERGDGLLLDYGLPVVQSLENINPLSPTRIEFRAKAHLDDVENIYLLRNSELIGMNKIEQDGSYDYFQLIVSLENENEEFNYCFVYVDGGKKFYLLDGGFSNEDNQDKHFYYFQQ